MRGMTWLVRRMSDANLSALGLFVMWENGEMFPAKPLATQHDMPVWVAKRCDTDDGGDVSASGPATGGCMSDPSGIEKTFEGKDLGRGMMAQRIEELEVEVARLKAAVRVFQQAECDLLKQVWVLTAENRALRRERGTHDA
jgi:hypothetical protein